MRHLDVPIDSLVDVIGAFLSAGGSDGVAERWRMVEQRVEAALDLQPEEAPPVEPELSVKPEPSVKPERAGKPQPAPRQRHDSLDCFLDDDSAAERERQPTQADAPAHPAAPERGRADSLENFLQPVDKPAAADAPRSESSRAENPRAENPDPGPRGPGDRQPPSQTTDAERAQAPAVSERATVERLLNALGIDGPEGGADIERVEAAFEQLQNFFYRTEGNLDHVFKTIKLPVRVPRFDQELRAAIAEDRDLSKYLESVRDCWKAFVKATWNGLRRWCDKIEASIDPTEIEAQARERRMKPWQLYQDRFASLALHDSIFEHFRTTVKGALRKENPELMD